MAEERACNKVVYDGNVLIDLTTDSIGSSSTAAGRVLSGYTFHGADGEVTTGSIATRTSLSIQQITAPTPGLRVYTPNAGYYAAGVSSVVPATTVPTPTISTNSNGELTSSVTVSSGAVLADTAQTATVDPTTLDSNLTAENVRAGTTIFNITGTMSPTEGMNLESGTKTLTSSSATYSPSSGYDGFSSITVSVSDSDLTAANIKKGVDILGTVGTYTSDADATAAQILSGKTAYVNGSKITGTISSVSGSTITPGTTRKTAIAAGKYASGAIYVAGSSYLTAANIKKGTTIFGVTGTYTSDATATAAAIRTGQTAYVNGSKITGTIADQAGGTYTPTTSDQTVASASKYLTSNVIVKGDANLVAANIASGVTIFNVEGTYEGEPEYIVSSTEPSASSSYKIWIQP